MADGLKEVDHTERQTARSEMYCMLTMVTSLPHRVFAPAQTHGVHVGV
jgi:hypothetical protein